MERGEWEEPGEPGELGEKLVVVFLEGRRYILQGGKALDSPFVVEDSRCPGWLVWWFSFEVCSIVTKYLRPSVLCSSQSEM